ncbi:MAG: DUF1540 domain-containing protein [Eubacteriales bacterium]
MPSPDVKCEVNTCTHWLPGGYCSASNIDILNEEVGQMSETAAQTECKTFSERRGIANMLGSLDNVNWGGLAVGMFLRGNQVTPTVTCVVDSCAYWEDGNLCNAEAIQVTGRGAKECQATDCHTFITKE